MAIISQLNFEDKYGEEKWEEIHALGEKWAKEQAAYLNANAPAGWSFTEGGTRRRLSARHQRNTLSTLWNEAKPFVNGTSNVYLGMEMGMPIYGSIAHQLIMFYQTIVGIEQCNRYAIKDYHEHFQGRLNTGLSDTLGDKKWDMDFTKDLMAIVPKERWDSGNAYNWADARLAALNREGIPTEGRTLNFSNDLNFEKAFDLFNKYQEKINTSYMLGTYITNTLPVHGHRAVSQVIKLMWATQDEDRFPLTPTIKTGADVDASKLQCECPRLKDFTLSYLGRL
jgi:nicotinate phosphoribosyltransferase